MTPVPGATGVGSVLGERYELTGHVARGDVADVYEGVDRSLRRRVAVKVFHAGAPGARERFGAEIATLLGDPTVQVYDAGEWSDAGGYVVLELAEEGTLLSSLTDGFGPPPPTVVGDGPVDGEAPTQVVAIGGDTSVMPALLRPTPPADVADADSGSRSRPLVAAGASPALWAVLAAVALAVVLLAARGGGGIEVPTPTTEAVQVTSPPPSTTTAPPTTAEPSTERSGKGKGRDKGDD